MSTDIIEENKDLVEEEEVDADGRRVSFWSFFREAGNVPLHELLRREEESERQKQREASSAHTNQSTQPQVERKSKGLSMKATSFLFAKKRFPSKNRMVVNEKNTEEKEDN